MIGGKFSEGGGGILTLVAQAEEDADARLDWAGCGILRTEDGILLIVKGDDNLSGLVEMLGGSIPVEEGSLTKNMNSMRGQNWTVRRWPVHLVYSQDQRQK